MDTQLTWYGQSGFRLTAGDSRVLIAHGRNDPVIPVTFARRAREILEAAGFDVDYRESEAAHNVDPGDVYFRCVPRFETLGGASSAARFSSSLSFAARISSFAIRPSVCASRFTRRYKPRPGLHGRSPHSLDDCRRYDGPFV